MSLFEYAVDERAVQWVEKREGGFSKALADGLDGRPAALVTIFPEGNETETHFHTSAQFQVVLGGSVTFPGHPPLDPISVHYSDIDTPYGPFVSGSGLKRLKLMVLRPRKCALVCMKDPEGRKLRNPYGREFYGESKDAQWGTLGGLPVGLRRKVLFGKKQEVEPKAALWECAPHRSLPSQAAPFGAYHVLVGGSTQVGGNEVTPYWMRFVKGDEAPAPLVAGPGGATWLVLNFDKAANE